MVQCCLAYVDPVVGAVVLLAVFFPFRDVRNFRLRQPALLIHRQTFCFPPIHTQPAPLKFTVIHFPLHWNQQESPIPLDSPLPSRLPPARQSPAPHPHLNLRPDFYRSSDQLPLAPRVLALVFCNPFSSLHRPIIIYHLTCLHLPPIVFPPPSSPQLRRTASDLAITTLLPASRAIGSNEKYVRAWE
jgi:hypothetical protein